MNAERPLRRIDGRGLSPVASAAVRRLALQLVERGMRPSVVMARFGLCRTTIYRWMRTVRDRGAWALAPKRHPGRAPRVDRTQARRVAAWIVGHAPHDHGLSGRMWTRRAVSALLESKLGVHLGPIASGRLLARLGLRPPPAREAPSLPEGARLLFAVDGRGAFLCARLPANASPRLLALRGQRLQALAGRPVGFVSVGPVAQTTNRSVRG